MIKHDEDHWTRFNEDVSIGPFWGFYLNSEMKVTSTSKKFIIEMIKERNEGEDYFAQEKRRNLARDIIPCPGIVAHVLEFSEGYERI